MPGIDYMNNKMLKYAGPKLLKEIFNLFGNMHDTEKIPREWLGGGVTILCTNISEYLTSNLELQDELYGFRKGVMHRHHTHIGTNYREANWI